MQAPDNSKEVEAQKKFPHWLKILLVSFAITFAFGYLGGIQNIQKDYGKEGVLHWEDDYLGCVKWCCICGALSALPSTGVVMALYGTTLLFRKNR
ncbi:MAG: hypothetical protein ACRDHZ_02740 [Ktedonobacteraceae bacterium]